MLMLNQLVGFGAGGPQSTGVIEANPTPPSGTNTWAGPMFFDRAWTVDNDKTVFKIGFKSPNPATVTLKLALRTGAGNYTIVVSESFAHTGSGWEDFALASPYNVPSSGTYYAGVYPSASLISDNHAGNARGFKTGDLGLGAQTGFTEDSGNTPAVRVTY